MRANRAARASRCRSFRRAVLAGHALCALLLGLAVAPAGAGTLTIKTNTLANTPDLLGYNSGHFYPGSNTREWWRYSGVTGARVFLTASVLEPSDSIAGRGDGVSDQNTFIARRAALRADPLNTNYINWPYLTNRYGVTASHGANVLQPNYALSQLRQMGIQILVCITASESTFVITNAADWAGKWELWQFYYAQAFHLSRQFDVRRFQMYNEPDHAPAVPQAEYLQRLQLISDAIQSALADVNSLYGKSLAPLIHAPVITTPSYNSWAQLVVNNRHVNFLGASDPNFWLLQNYDYHQYNATPSAFGANLATLRASLASAMAPEPAFPTSITEFNVHTAAMFDTIPDTLDDATQYPNFGAIAVNLVRNHQDELYAFKLSQTDGDAGDNYPVRKNGMHYVDNRTAPYNIGGVTKAGEVWRLFNKAFAPGRQIKDMTVGSGLSALTFLASYDPVSARCYVYSVNNSATATSLTVDVSGYGVQDSNRVLIEEVSDAASSAVTHYSQVAGGVVTTFTQPSNSVWLYSIPTKPQHYVSAGVPTLVVNAVEDAMVKDGTNKDTNYGAQTNLLARNDPADASNRSASFIKFRLPQVYLPDVQLAVLSVSGRTISTNASVQAHVYAITNSAWSQTNITWTTAPNLRQNIVAGNHITNDFLTGVGDSAFLQGQLVFSTTTPAEMQIDVTDFIRTRTNYDVSFLVAQQPRWNITLPSLVDGDTQPDGIQMASLESAGSGTVPRLRLVRLKDSDGDGLSDESEVNVFGTDPAKVDTDNDGLSDGDEVLLYGTSPLNPDSDGDHMKDGDEIAAGTDPLDPASVFQFTAFQRAPDSKFRVQWSAVTNRFYRLYRSTSATNAPWQEIFSSPGTNGTLTYLDPMTDAGLTNRPAAFYRVRVER
jgi:hypothetical protein